MIANMSKQFSDGEIINFLDDSQSPLSVRVLDFSLSDEYSKKCSLKFECNFGTYQKIESESLFSLKPTIFASSDKTRFRSDRQIEIEVTLKPRLLAEGLQSLAGSSYGDRELLLALSLAIRGEESTASKIDLIEEREPLCLFCRDWLALSVRQQQADGSVIVIPTFWSYLNFDEFPSKPSTQENFYDALDKFIKDRDDAEKSVAKRAIEKLFEEIGNEFIAFNNADFMQETEETISEVFEEIGQAIEDWSKQPSVDFMLSEHPIYDAIIRFFSEDDWEFAKLKGESVLRLAAQGKNAQLTCYAKALEERHIFIFYSIAPLQVPKKKRRAIAELIARINHGLLLGNLELNFETGEIYCKTSIDVTGDRLTHALIRNLVYTNVLTMDRYLPGITAVLTEGTSPQEAVLFPDLDEGL